MYGMYDQPFSFNDVMLITVKTGTALREFWQVST